MVIQYDLTQESLKILYFLFIDITNELQLVVARLVEQGWAGHVHQRPGMARNPLSHVWGKGGAGVGITVSLYRSERWGGCCNIEMERDGGQKFFTHSSLERGEPEGVYRHVGVRGTREGCRRIEWEGGVATPEWRETPSRVWSEGVVGDYKVNIWTFELLSRFRLSPIFASVCHGQRGAKHLKFNLASVQ
jgi:hypothetical protein